MQLKDQVRKARDWKVVAALATASALGISGLALADSGDPTNPDTIDLKDRTQIAQVTTPTSPGADLSNLAFSADSPNDSPFDDAATASASADSPQLATTVDSGVTADSPAGGSSVSSDSVDNSADS